MHNETQALLDLIKSGDPAAMCFMAHLYPNSSLARLNSNIICENILSDSDVIGEGDILFHAIFYQKIAPALFGLITAVGVLGNLVVVALILLRKVMRTSVNLSLLNLALCDIIFVSICVPFVAYHYAADSWKMGEVMCKLSQFLLYVTVYVSVYTLLLISGLRFLTVVHGPGTARLRTKRNICVLIGVIWGIFLVANTPIILVYRVKENILFPGAEPYYYCAMESQDIGRRLFVSFFVLTYICPLIGICCLYLSILKFLKTKRHSSLRRSGTCNGACANSRARSSHATRIVIVVVVVFGLCWLPLHIHLLIAYFGKQPSSNAYQVFRVLCHCVAYSNSCMNPFIYHYVSKDFRNAFRLLFLPSRCHRGQNTDIDNMPERLALNSNFISVTNPQ